LKPFLPILVLGIVLTGCSGKSSPSPSPSQPTSPNNSHSLNGGAIAGFHGGVAKTTTSYHISLLSTVYAQTTSVSLTGTYTGYGFYNNLGNVPEAFPVYGVGTLFSSCAGPSSTSGPCPSATASGSMDPGQVLASQALTETIASVGSSFSPAIVTGSGTLSPLVVYAYANNPTTAGTGDLIEIWTVRNGQISNTGISCTLPVQVSATPTLQRCESSSTFSVQDEDGIVASVTLNPGDNFGNLALYLVKQ
jgi:hypothetical protein